MTKYIVSVYREITEKAEVEIEAENAAAAKSIFYALPEDAYEKSFKFEDQCTTDVCIREKKQQ